MDHQHMSGGRKQSASSPEAAIASEVFDQFCNATTLKSILGYYRQLCELLKLRPNTINQFYPKLKSKLRSWKAQALWKKFDQRANHKCYNRGKACPNTRVLIIGGGPCGLRSAIEAQLLGAKVVVVEKRDRMSRNNVLHLWPFVIHDLRGLGAKKFFGKFCAGSIDHISIRQLQCILLKVALILGVEFHESVSFDSLVPPSDRQEEGKVGWRAKTTPVDHPVSQYEFDVLIGADGKRNTLEGFKRKEFRGKLAIAITANFINKRTEAEARVEEISGVAFIFNQKFFKELYQETGIDLENIVYYKDDTHYFVMTAKKHSLIDKGVIRQDHADTAKLLAKENVDRDALMHYAREAAEFSTEYQMMDMEFAVNHYGQPDVAMFDFTSMYAAENASRVMERNGHRLLMILVGDSLLEPFWPTGSGCARGFLSSLDACWAIKGWGSNMMSPLEVIAERESIYRLLGQTTPENLNRDYAAYTLDPHTRYPNLNVRSVTPIQVRSLLDTDDPESIKSSALQSDIDVPKKRRRRDVRADSQVHPDTLLRWLQKQVALYDSVHIEDMGASFKSGLAICAIIHRYRPDLIDFHSLRADDATINNQLAFDILEKELGIPPVMTGEEMNQCETPDKLTMFSYLTQIYEVFRGEIPHVKHPKLEMENEENVAQLGHLTPEQKAQLIGRIAKQDGARMRQSRSRHSNENIHSHADRKSDTVSRRSRKRRSTEKMGATVDREPKMLAGHQRGNVDEEFSGRIKSIEDKLKGSTPAEKKPKDLLRAIGKIEKTDWNVKEIEKKIEENKMGRGVRTERVERVPKWSREQFSICLIQFLARQIKMEKRGHDQKESDSKYADIDNTLKNIGKKIKEGNVLGHNKVSAMAEQFSNKNQDSEPKVQKSSTKTTLILPAQGGSEMCHFCNKRVYLMERLSTEGKFFHRGCFRCEYCSTSLRIGNHTFDREKNGGRFYCTQHFGLLGNTKDRTEKKKVPVVNKENIPASIVNMKVPEMTKMSPEGISGLDLLDRGQTPERIEFENLARISDADEAHSQMDEDEWTDRNFGASTAELGSSDEISDMSDSDDDNEVYEEAIDQPLTTEGTLELAKNWTLRYSHSQLGAEQSDTGSNEYEDSSDEYTSEDDESGTATENEEDVRARELRKQEVWLKTPPRSSDTDTGSETEVASDNSSTEDSEENSATEISTDSEFEHDGATPTQHDVPEIAINDSYVRRTRGNYVPPKKVQVKSKVISSVNGNLKNQEKVLELKQEAWKTERGKETTTNVPQNEVNSKSITVKAGVNSPTPLINPRKGDYLLNRNHSTEGIASKLSLELKKRYLLGGPALGGSVIKSGSTSNVDTKLRNLTDAISQHQKLLNPAPEPSPTMQAFLQGANKLRSSNTQLSPLSAMNFFSGPSSKSSHAVDRETKTLFNTDSPRNSADISTSQLPDLLKETNILKSKTAPNVLLCTDTEIENKKEEKQITPEQDSNLVEKEVKNNKWESKQNVKDTEETENKKDMKKSVPTDIYESNEDSRPRSPLHETSIIVPQVDWNKAKEDSKETLSSDDSEIDSDSLSSSEEESARQERPNLITSLSPPRVRVHNTNGDILLDEALGGHEDLDEGCNFEPDSIECSLYARNNEKPLDRHTLPFETFTIPRTEEIPEKTETCADIDNEVERLELQDDSNKISSSNRSSPTSIASGSNKQDDSEENDVTTAALTETEFSEWARDGDALVTDDLEFDMNSECLTGRRNAALFHTRKTRNECEGKGERDQENEGNEEINSHRFNVDFPCNVTSKLLVNGENIDYMDTDNESLLDDSLQEASNTALLKNRGYLEFVNVKTNSPSLEKKFVDAPIAKLDFEAEVSDSEENIKDTNVIEIKPVTMDDVMDKLYGNVTSLEADRNAQESVEEAKNACGEMEIASCVEDRLTEAVNKEPFQSMEEDSLLIVETAEDTTTSEAITILASPVNPPRVTSMEMNKEEITEEARAKAIADPVNPEYLEYVKRLQSRIAEFSNAKDSIDVRKSKRKNSKGSNVQLRTAEMITEEIKHQESTVKDNLTSSDSFNSPSTLRKLEEITKERSKQKNVIQDLLMDKLEAHKQKSAEKRAKRAARTSSFTPTSGISPIRSGIATTSITAVNKFVPTSINSSTNSYNDTGITRTTFGEAKKCLDKELSMENRSRDGTTNESSIEKLKDDRQTTNLLSSSTRKEKDIFATPVAPPRMKHEEAKRTTEKARQDARERARLKSDEDLGLSPEDRIRELRMKVLRRQMSADEKRETDETPKPTRVRPHSFVVDEPEQKLRASKSTDNMRNVTRKMKFQPLVTANAKSMDESLHTAGTATTENSPAVVKREKRQSKDPERRRSIIQAVSDFFFKKESSPSPNQKDKLSVFRLTSKSKGKLDKVSSPSCEKRPKSVCEDTFVANFLQENKIPLSPPPINYEIPVGQVSEDSLSDDDTRATALSTSCMQKVTVTEGTSSSLPRKSKAKKLARQAQLKRLRMAQEIQRKLEETEVKQRELESRGVSVEKALRGEGECSDREEADLLREWFDLMKERTELRRFEKELLVRAQEVQLEDRHERLQHELRERLADDDNTKTGDDVKKEGEILTEMLEIVAKRDSLIALLEEERQRYRDEDRDLEARMLAKGLRLTPIKKCDSKYVD